MFSNQIDSPIFVQELKNYIEQGITENRLLEFKSKLPGKQDENEPLLLKPICSFANTNGGYLIYGIDDTKPWESQSGVEVVDEDQLKQKLTNIIEHSTEPKITQYDIVIHKLSEPSKYLLIIFVAKSYSSPHRIRKSNIFYGRSSSGAYQMDINEIRNIMLLHSTFIDKITEFVNNRSTKIRKNLSVIPLAQGIKFLLHFVPVASVMNTENFSIIFLKEKIDEFKIFENFKLKATLEGLLFYEPTIGKYHHSEKYNLYYRSGIIESVRAFSPDPTYLPDRPNLLPIIDLQNYAVTCLDQFKNDCSRLKLFPPYILFFSLIGLGNSYLYIDPSKGTYPFDRPEIQLSTEIINAPNFQSSEILKPIFDVIWNCCGFDEAEYKYTT
ncbi:hypothetical protein B0B39_18455 (plasmid) [Legionella longbeachae]|uniref:AlbA family DNA-binding domain-containing protein n=1 Tax=Legionella longbeachae TaxID=450 RepID=UPI000A1C12BF|nr:ATP-binding protein [Legionella longbeachae]ARM35517.1 hypothetical protein B0B39_18455 [Legionella longbeachae]